MKKVRLKDVKEGGLLHLKDSENSPIWVRNHYDRGSKTYSLSAYDDVNREIFRKSNCFVYID